MEEKRICSKCSELKHIEDYYTVTSKKTGSTYTYKYCKKCHYKLTKPNRKKWMKENPDQGRKLSTKAVREYRRRGTPGIYLIQTNKGSYVGQSSSIEYRMTQHKGGGETSVEYMKNVEMISHTILEVVPDRKKRQKREAYWIGLLRPELNIRSNPDKKETRNRKKKLE